jgi:hypothetical protein
MPYSPYNYAEIVSGGYNGASAIHIKSNSAWAMGEVDSTQITVKPGDHIVMGCYIKTGTYSPDSWVTFGFDFHTTYNGLSWITGYNSSAELAFPQLSQIVEGAQGDKLGVTFTGDYPVAVGYGSDWTLVKMDFTVPTATYYYVFDGSGTSTYVAEGVHPDSIICWTANTGNGEAWFSEPFLYVNPSIDPTVSPTPIRTATPTPHTTIAPASSVTFSALMDWFIWGVIAAGFIGLFVIIGYAKNKQR